MTSEFQRHRVIPKMQTDRLNDDLIVVAEINIRLRRNGAMSIEGSVGDKKFALAMLDNARDAVFRQGLVSMPELIIPEKSVEILKLDT